MPLLLFFTFFTLLDFVVLFSVGSRIGLVPTLGLVLATGFAGLYLIRQQGVATLARARQRMSQGELPSSELLAGAALIFGGALMLAPGFLSDALGLLCVVPGARRQLARLLALLNLRVLGAAYRQQHDQASRPDDWHQTGTQSSGDEQQRHDSGQPLEGDFISRDEPRR
ncbi:FxsA family protein [Billgrantia kenyensis]|uniref:FxsA family protein n=1 Tax=Billgrantia kenyensis TaxID=321266 RepID=A0A7V9VYE1_9GAMM|nr:FxsA family protein [Halomonas kenyensis]MBA2777720.1 FxsA family protein [Halomonas kenyensis]MCG6660390.1 FxsA family protein [Halomonas kenyensis]